MQSKIDKFSQETIDFLKTKQSFITDDFLERNLISQAILNENTAEIKYSYQVIFNNLCSGNIEEYISSLITLTNIYIKMEIPYIALLNELNHIQNIIMELFINYDKKDEIISIYKFYSVSQNIVAKEYLTIYTKKLISICNNRLSSIHDMVENFVVDHYAEHLRWLIKLTQCIQNTNTNTTSFPQTDKTLCNFGKWLAIDAKNIIKNNSKLKELDKVHSQLHYISSQIKQI